MPRSDPSKLSGGTQAKLAQEIAAIKAATEPRPWEAGSRPKQLPPDHPRHHMPWKHPVTGKIYRCRDYNPDCKGPSPDWTTWIFLAGRGCVAGHTRVYLPEENRHERIDILASRGEPITVMSLTENGPQPGRTDGAPFLKGVADLYEVQTEDGRIITVTDQHRFLTPRGWQRLADVHVGQLLASGDPVPHGIGVPLSASSGDVLRSTGTSADSLGDYRKYPDSRDLRPHQEEADGQVAFPSPGDAVVHNHAWLHADALGDGREYSHPRPPHIPRSRNNYARVELSRAGAAVPVLSAGFGWSRDPSPSGSRSPRRTFPVNAAREAHAQEYMLGVPGRSLRGGRASLTSPEARYPLQIAVGRWSDKTLRQPAPTLSGSLPRDSVRRSRREAAACLSSGTAYLDDIRWTRITSITFMGTDVFYDMHVPGPENYLAEGFWNHNTGKTKAGAQWAIAMALSEPGIYVAVCAPTYADVQRVCFEGQALALDTYVPTPYGATTMGELRAGDAVIGGDGLPCRVTHAFPVLKERECYRVTFRGGASVIADADHKWLVRDYLDRAYSRRDGQRREPRVMTTAEMATSVRYLRKNRTSLCNYSVDVTRASYDGSGPAPVLPIDPYALGYWLGDGTAKSGEITTMDPEVVKYFIYAGYEITEHAPKPGNKARTYGILGLFRQLRLAGLLRNKHIPDIYLRADPEDRLRLLQGLMDSDGCITERGQCEFVNTNKQLIDDFIDLACGLGVKASVPRPKKTPAGKQRWTVKFTTTSQVFRLPRKRERIPSSYRDADFWHIESIERVPSVPVRCISVDSADHTYLVTRHHIATHNSGIIREAGPGEIAEYNKNNLTIKMRNGSIIQGYSAEKADSIRGANLSYCWFDELAMIRYIKFFDYGLKPAMRVKPKDCEPRLMITTTPKNMKLIRKLVKQAEEEPGKVHITRAISEENPFYSAGALKDLRREYKGTYLERQELEGELITESDGAMFKMEDFNEYRIEPGEEPEFRRIVVAIDPATSASDSGDETGIVVAAESADHHFYTLEDCSMRGSAEQQMSAVASAYRRWDADVVVGEQNGVKDYMRAALAVVDPNIPLKLVPAMKGKQIRAQPVSILASQGRIHMVGTGFDKLEEQLSSMTPDDDRSLMHDDRADAWVWAMRELTGSAAGSYKEAYGFFPCDNCGQDVNERMDKACKNCGQEVHREEKEKVRDKSVRWSNAYQNVCDRGHEYPMRLKSCPKCKGSPEVYMAQVARISDGGNSPFGYTGKNFLGRKI